MIFEIEGAGVFSSNNLGIYLSVNKHFYHRTLKTGPSGDLPLDLDQLLRPDPNTQV